MKHIELCCAQWLNQRLRLLWSQHIYRTRLFIISTLSELKDLSYVTKWLLENPGDFARTLAQYYGREQADRFEKLFTDHLLVGADLVNAMKNGEREKTAFLREQWYQNADEIALFLGNLNPYWNREEWRKMMYDHLSMTEKEVNFRLSDQYEADIEIFNAIEVEALKMADTMSQGMIKQFKLC